jgi:hypothetical protein
MQREILLYSRLCVLPIKIAEHGTEWHKIIIINCEQSMFWDMVIACSKVLIQHMPEETKENQNQGYLQLG